MAPLSGQSSLMHGTYGGSMVIKFSFSLFLFLNNRLKKKNKMFFNCASGAKFRGKMLVHIKRKKKGEKKRNRCCMAKEIIGQSSKVMMIHL